MIFQIDSPEVQKAFRNDNFFIENYNNVIGNNEKTCVIYFSSNEIYYPNTSQAFEFSIVTKDKYEWKNNKYPGALKHIFVRDLHKQWYITGINNKLDGPERLLEFLKLETEGFKVVTIGSSAGGYAAILFGSLLNCQRTYAFNAQFNLNLVVKNSTKNVNPVLFDNCDKYKAKYFDLSNFINDTTKIYYFQSFYSSFDIEQFDSLNLAAKERIQVIRFKTSNHGFPFLRSNLNVVFNLGSSDLNSYVNKVFHPIFFSIKLVGLMETLKSLIQSLMKRIQKKCLEKFNSKLFRKEDKICK